MGLDVVEIIMDIEDAFDISLSNTECGEARTVGELHECIVRKIAAKNPSPAGPMRPAVCLTTVSFVKLRAAFMSVLGVDRQSLRPDSVVAEVLPREQRQIIWQRLQDVVGFEIPLLKRPQWLKSLIWAVVFDITISGVLWMAGFLDLVWAALFGLLLLAPTVGILLTLLTRPFATNTGADFSTLGGLARVMLARNYRRISAQYDSCSPSDIWETLRTILVEQLNVPREDVTRDARIIEDLGCA